LSRTLPNVTPLSGDGLQRITDVTVSRTTKSGRVGELRIVFERGDIRIPGPTSARCCDPTPTACCRARRFSWTVTKSGGQVTRLVAAGAGSGHAVGMCQWEQSAERVRARLSDDSDYLLPGTKIEKLY